MPTLNATVKCQRERPSRCPAAPRFGTRTQRHFRSGDLGRLRMGPVGYPFRRRAGADLRSVPVRAVRRNPKK